MASLLDELGGGRPARIGCSICNWLETQSAEDQAIWKKHLALPVKQLPHSRAFEAMRKRGYPFTSAHPLARHRHESH